MTEAFRTRGVGPAMHAFLRLSEIDPDDHEPGVTRPLSPYRAANVAHFLTHDVPAVRAHRLDPATLPADRVVVGVGRTGRDNPAHRSARALARRLPITPLVFPGGHNGCQAHPAAFAVRLGTVFARDVPAVAHPM